MAQSVSSSIYIVQEISDRALQTDTAVCAAGIAAKVSQRTHATLEKAHVVEQIVPDSALGARRIIAAETTLRTRLADICASASSAHSQKVAGHAGYAVSRHLAMQTTVQVELTTETSAVGWERRSRGVEDVAVLAQVALQLGGSSVGAFEAVGDVVGTSSTFEDAAASWTFFLREVAIGAHSAAVFALTDQTVR